MIFGILWTQYLSSQRPERKILCSAVSNTGRGYTDNKELEGVPWEI